MISAINLTIISWLILATGIRFSSAHSHTSYQIDDSGRSLSYNKFNNGGPSPQKNIPFKNELEANYGTRNYYSTFTTTAPFLRSGSSQHDDWMPKITSQSASSEIDRLAKIQLLQETESLKEKLIGSSRQSQTMYQGYVRPKQSQSQPYIDTLLRTERSPSEFTSKKDGIYSGFQNPQLKKDKYILSENDIMWIHYRPPTDGYHNQEIQQQSPKLPKYMSPASKISERSYEVEELDNYSDDKLVKQSPQNIHKILDQSISSKSTTNIIDLTKRQTSTEAWLDNESSSNNGMKKYNFDYEDRLISELSPDSNETPLKKNLTQQDTDEDVKWFDNEDDFKSHLSSKKYASQNIGGFINLATISTPSPTDENFNVAKSFNSVLNQMIIETSTASVKPIKPSKLSSNSKVIMEPQTTTLTPEYYRQLFDSFSSGHHRQMDTEGILSNKKNQFHRKEKRLPQGAAAQATADVSMRASPYYNEYAELPVTKKSLEEMQKKNKTEKSNSSFFTMTSDQLMDLLPETLKMNLIAVRRVLVDCYTSGDKNKTTFNSVNCFKKITFDILDKAIESDMVKLTDTVSLVKENKTSDGQGRSATSESTNKTEWLPNIIEKIQRLFSTHTLRLKLMDSHETDNYQMEGRRRNRHTFRRVFPVVASIYMVITSVLMPLVFQFMAVMAGKSFMVGKTALFFILFTNFNKFLSVGIENVLPWYSQVHHPSPPPSPPSPHIVPVPYPVPIHSYSHQKKDNRKKDVGIYNYSYTTKRVPIKYSYYTLE